MSGRLEERVALSDTQYITIVISTSICAGLSVSCSTLIVFVAIRRLKQDHAKFPVQQRLLLLLGLLDILFSLGVISGHFLIPAGQTPTAIGTIQSCTVQGTMTHIGTIGTQLCNMCLALYYYLTVTYRKTTNDLKYWEYTWFTIIIGWPSLLVGVALYQNNFGVWEGAEGCYFGGTYPMSCDLNPDVTCQRGDGAYRFLIWRISIISFLLASLACFILTFSVWFGYRKLIRQSSRYNFAGAATNRNHRMASEVTRQTVVYTAVYFNMVLWMMAVQFINPIVFASTAPLTVKFLFILISNVFVVLTGVFNCIAYMGPSYNRWKRAYPHLSSWELLRHAIDNENPPRSTSYNIPTGETAPPGRGTTNRQFENDTIGYSSACIRPTSSTSINLDVIPASSAHINDASTTSNRNNIISGNSTNDIDNYIKRKINEKHFDPEHCPGKSHEFIDSTHPTTDDSNDDKSFD